MVCGAVVGGLENDDGEGVVVSAPVAWGQKPGPGDAGAAGAGADCGGTEGAAKADNAGVVEVLAKGEPVDDDAPNIDSGSVLPPNADVDVDAGAGATPNTEPANTPAVMVKPPKADCLGTVPLFVDPNALEVLRPENADGVAKAEVLAEVGAEKVVGAPKALDSGPVESG